MNLPQLANKYISYKMKELFGEPLLKVRGSEYCIMDFTGRKDQWIQLISDHSDLLSDTDFELFQELKND